MVVADWPIQFLPATKPIELEAIENAHPLPLADDVAAYVPPPEYLMAIAIELGRPKDVIRLHCFHEQRAYDPAKLQVLLDRHNLGAKWERYLASFGPWENS